LLDRRVLKQQLRFLQVKLQVQLEQQEEKRNLKKVRNCNSNNLVNKSKVISLMVRLEVMRKTKRKRK
jgi:hypothetical protein